MSKNSTDLKEVEDLDNSQGDAASSASIDAPKIEDGKLDLEQRSVKTVAQANNICKALEKNNNTVRAPRAARMQAVYDGESPLSYGQKANAAASWQTNVNFGTMAVVTDRKVQRMVATINGMTYLTKSSLPPSIEGWKKKSEAFQAAFTRMARSWGPWADLVQQTTQENTLQGYAAAAFLNPEDWHPELFTVCNFFVPEGAGQFAGNLQVLVLKKDILLNDFISFFLDVDTDKVKDVGWNLENCLQACNKSGYSNGKDDGTTADPRSFVDMVRDGTSGLTYGSSSARVVKVYYLLNREYDNKVSLWIIERETGKLLRFSSKLWDKFEDAAALFSLQPGNGSLYSSKGVGRMIIGPVTVAETVKNKMVDNCLLASLRVISADAASISKMAPKVVAPFILLDKGVTIQDAGFSLNTTDLQKLDAFVTLNIESAAGAYAGVNLESLSNQQTATGEKIQAAARQESADSTESRYAAQFADVITVMQRIAYSDKNIKEAKRLYAKFQSNGLTAAELDLELAKGLGDEEAMKSIIELFSAGLTEDEIKIIRAKDASGLAYIDDAANSAAIGAVNQLYAGDPRVNQEELLYRNILQMAGPETAKALVIPGIDQTVLAEAIRAQQGETTTMINYAENLATLAPDIDVAPVSPRDNHLVHLATIRALLDPAGKVLIANPTAITQPILKTIELHLNHAQAHVAAMTKDSTNTPEAKELVDWLNGYIVQFKQAVTAITAAKQIAEGGQEQVAPPAAVPAEVAAPVV